MKTGELYAEQVFIGSLIIAIILLPWLPELQEKLTSIDTAMGVAGGSLALGLAFWLGIPFDRFADSLSDRLDRHNRLRFALQKAISSKLPKVVNEHCLDADIYAEDRFRLLGLRDEEAVVNWIDYHRSRIRLVRALALYGPAVTLALTWGVWRSVKETVPHDNYCWLGGIAASYILWMVLASLGGRLPRTDEPKFIDYAKRWHSVDSKSEHFVKTTTSNLRVWISEWRLLAVPVVLLGISLWLGFDSDDPAGRLAASAGVAITLLSAWSWWRISFTYRSYLYDLARYSKQP